MIYADDLGFGDLGCYGSKIPTPNLDNIASEGVVFESFYSASPVCSPSRAALLTGRYPTRMGVLDVLHPDSATGLPASEVTLAQMLRPSRYHNMCIGKWHLGSRPQYMPTNRGFDEFFGVPYSTDMSPLPLMRDTAVIEPQANLEALTARYTEEAVSFIGRAKSAPFFLYMAHTLPHIPLAASPRFQGKSGFGPYGDAVAEIDWSVGEVLRAVQNNGLDENTLIMFSSDHGPWFEGSTGRSRGRKGETWDGGIHVPFVARYPGRIPASRVCSTLATTMDILPTVAHLTRSALPAARVDGVNIFPLMTGLSESVEHDVLLFFDSWDLQCARLGPWKLHVARHNTPPWLALPPQWRRNVTLAQPELYDIERDPGESCNVAADHPGIVAEIRARIGPAISTFPDQIQTRWRNMQLAPAAKCPSGAWPADPTR
jgi:arylsulfatase